MSSMEDPHAPQQLQPGPQQQQQQPQSQPPQQEQMHEQEPSQQQEPAQNVQQPDPHDPCILALQSICKNKEALVKSSLGAIMKLLKALQKAPEDPKNRKTRLDNPLIKKFITDVSGALDFMKAVGFETTHSTTEGKTVAYLQLEKPDLERVARAIDLLDKKLDDVDHQIKAASSAPKSAAKRTVCAGGCGFWGDETQENYCSVCYKKKHLGVKPSEAKGAVPPGRCIKACGNFGSEKFQGMCSQCHTKHLLAVKRWKRKLRVAFIKLRALHRFLLGRREEQTNKKRCWKCKRKVGIAGIECRCGYVFCGVHRYADEHECRFDHKKMHRTKLLKENRQVVAKKFDKLEDDL